jgi:hypothetical protein
MRIPFRRAPHAYLLAYPLLLLLLLTFFPPESVSQEAKEGGSANPAIDQAQEPPAAAEGAATEGEPADEEEDAPEEPPKPKVDPAKVLEQAEPLFEEKKTEELKTLLDENPEAVDETPRLQEMRVLMLLAEKKPNINDLKRYGEPLFNSDQKNLWANYALGKFWLETKKSDLTKALKHLGIAKSLKDAPAEIGTLYWTAMAKKYGMYLGLGLLLLVVGIAKRKKKPAVSGVVAGPVAETAPKEVSSDEILGLTATAPEKPLIPQPEPPPAMPPTLPIPPRSANVDPSPISDTVRVIQGSMSPIVEKVPPPPEEKKPVAQASGATPPLPPVLPVRERFPEPESIAVPPRPTTSPLPSVMPNLATPHASPARLNKQDYVLPQDIDLTTAASASSGAGRLEVPGNAEIDQIWEKLKRKAARTSLAPDSGLSLEQTLAQGASDAQGSSGRTTRGAASPAEGKSASGLRLNLDAPVSIDLTEEALKEDLIAKMKMFAIEDSEMRTLLQQRNPAHIPHLIEYIMMKPEPVRLAYVTRELGFYHDPALTDVLSGLLYHEDSRVILAAIQGLAETGGSAALLAVAPFLQSSVPILREAARKALEACNTKKLLSAFQELPGHPDERVREAGIFILSRMKGEPVVVLLTEMLKDHSAKVRQKAVLAMGYQKNPVYLETLREFFRNAEPEDKKLARKAIVYLQSYAPKPQPGVRT